MIECVSTQMVSHVSREKHGLTPPSTGRGTRWLVVVAGVAISAFAFDISTGFGTFWPAAWIAPIPVLLLAFRSSAHYRSHCVQRILPRQS